MMDTLLTINQRLLAVVRPVVYLRCEAVWIVLTTVQVNQTSHPHPHNGQPRRPLSVSWLEPPVIFSESDMKWYWRKRYSNEEKKWDEIRVSFCNEGRWWKWVSVGICGHLHASVCDNHRGCTHWFPIETTGYFFRMPPQPTTTPSTDLCQDWPSAMSHQWPLHVTHLSSLWSALLCQLSEVQ